MQVLFPVKGIQLGVAAAGIKYQGRDDLLIMQIAEGASVAGVFTQNAYCAAPVKVCREYLGLGNIRYCVINSGNANACTGEQGIDDARTTCSALADLALVKPEQVLPFSTGVIGEYLPMDKVTAGLQVAFDHLSSDNWDVAAKAIMTTDTRTKAVSKQFVHNGKVLTATGIAKGSGMIHPNMATMLAYIATDAAVELSVLNDWVREAADKSFNRITVDGDTSTNDACMLIATGKSGAESVTRHGGELYESLKAVVMDLHRELAQDIIRDAEGATKFVTLEVNGGASAQESLAIAHSVAKSPLVKTALFASDPNWGRIVCAIGYADVQGLDSENIKVWLDDVLIVEHGGRAESYTEQQGQAVMNKAELTIRIDLQRGDFTETVWTSDLSHDYVTINAGYRS